MSDDGIRLINHAIDQDDEGNVIFRAVIDPGFLHLIRIDRAAGAAAGGYQREEAKPETITSCAQSMIAGAKVPDVILGMRGQRYVEDGGAMWLRDPVYAIDGQQRIASAKRAMEIDPIFRPRLGATVYIPTLRSWEGQQFEILNTVKNKMPPGVHLLRGREQHEAINTLYLLTLDRDFALHSAVRWDQGRTAQHLLGAMTYMKAAIVLHQHALGRHMLHVSGPETVRTALRHYELGVGALRDNVRTFFEAIDKAWGIRQHTARHRVSWLRENFLIAFAAMLSQNLDFWTGDRGERLQISGADIRKLAGFDFDNPNIIALTGGGSQARRSLVLEIEAHLDSGRRTQRLRKRGAPPPSMAAE